MIFKTATQFSELDTEEKSLYIRDVFEYAAQNACEYDSDKFNTLVESIDDGELNCTIVHNDGAYLFLGNEETLTILTLYNETIFPKDNIFSFTGEDCRATTVTPDTFLRYVTAENVTKIPNVGAALSKSEWRNKEDAFLYDKGEPLLTLRLVARHYQKGATIVGTPSYLYCDSTSLISHQLTNCQNTHASPLPIQFPEAEGRGAVFSYGNVPFHAYNSRIGNDLLCQFMGLLPARLNYDDLYWKINESICSMNATLRMEKIGEDSPYACFTDIAKRCIDSHEISGAILIPLPYYVLACLEYQQSLPQEYRIKDKESQASDEAIEAAIMSLRDYLRTVKAEKTCGAGEEVSAAARP